MRISRMPVASVAVLTAVLAAAILADDAARATPGDGARSRTVEFTYVARVATIPAGARQLDLWIPVPRTGPAQQVEDISFEAPVAHAIGTEAEYGNSIAHLRFAGDDLKPFDVVMKVQVRRDERKDDHLGSVVRDAPAPRFLQEDRLVRTSGEVADIAAAAAGSADGSLAVGRSLYDAVLERMRYSKDGEGWGKGDTAHACSQGFGNCSDFHALFIGMARSRGIPARFLMGFPLPDERGEGKVGGYHCWAEFFVDDVGWVPVDASEADKHPEMTDYYFGSLTENRVEFSAGRDITLVPKQQGGPLNFFIYPYAEVDGAPFDGVAREFSFRDL